MARTSARVSLKRRSTSRAHSWHCAWLELTSRDSRRKPGASADIGLACQATCDNTLYLNAIATTTTRTPCGIQCQQPGMFADRAAEPGCTQLLRALTRSLPNPCMGYAAHLGLPRARVAVEALQLQAQRRGAAQRAVVHDRIGRRQILGNVGRALRNTSKFLCANL